jgi:tRNA threonylcarbamoyladenosine biosynthesis protein TsaE
LTTQVFSEMPILDPNTLEFFSRSPGQTRRAGIRLGALLQVGDLVCLAGDLGSGKTTLVQGIAQGWGSPDAVTSPTFVLVNTYRKPGGAQMHHLDAYRLRDGSEAVELDLDLMLESGALVIEWAERIESVLPSVRLWVDLRWTEVEHRNLLFVPQGEHYIDLLIDFRRQVYGG